MKRTLRSLWETRPPCAIVVALMMALSLAIIITATVAAVGH